MPLEGEYEPGTWDIARDQVELYESSNGEKGTVLNGAPCIILTNVGAKTGKLRKNPLIRVTDGTNYAVLGLVLERAGGAPVADLVQERVFAKAGVRHSGFGGTPTARGYERGEDQTVVAPKYPSTTSGGVATVSDVGMFLDALLQGRVVPPDVLAEMMTSRGSDGVDELGLGLRTPQDARCGPVWGQKGGNAAFATRAWTNTDTTWAGVRN